jgi:integrase
MKVNLMGVHRVKRRLADGSVRLHHYAWRGGPKIEAEPGTPAFLTEYLRLTRTRQQEPDEGTLGWIVKLYRESSDYQSLAYQTKRRNDPILQAISQEFGNMPAELAEARGARKDFLRWRESLMHHPRTAEMHLAVLKRLLGWAVDHEYLSVNKLAGATAIYKGSRRDVIWSDDQVARALAVASPGIALAMRLALDTGQRQGDLLRLPWPAYSAGTFRFKQRKTGAAVSFTVSGELAAILDALPRNTITILSNSRGKPWTSDGFQASWRKTLERAGIEGVNFHDLRGTFITRKYHSGWSIKQISEVTGHSERDAESIIRRHYLAVDLGERNGTKL